mgnify:CR=1 FL=1
MSNSKKNKKGHILNQFFSIIIDEIKPLNPQAIIIYGSYGRNEGAWILDKNNFLPYNDFDIVIVDDSTNNSNYNKKLNESLKKKLNVDWIDLQVLSRKKLKSLSKRTIFNYDLKYGSKVIYGDKEILYGTQAIFSEGISVNTLSCLILATPINNEPLLTQLIGRVVRKHDNKRDPVIIDIHLKGKTAQRQASNRMGYYMKQGYQIKQL